MRLHDLGVPRDDTTFSEKLRWYMEENSLNQKELSGFLGCSPQNISNWLRGKNICRSEKQAEFIFKMDEGDKPEPKPEPKRAPRVFGNQAFANEINAFMDEFHLQQTQVAKILGVSSASVSVWRRILRKCQSESEMREKMKQHREKQNQGSTPEPDPFYEKEADNIRSRGLRGGKQRKERNFRLVKIHDPQIVQPSIRCKTIDEINPFNRPALQAELITIL